MKTGRQKFLEVFRYAVIKQENTCTAQLALSIVFKYLFPKPRKIGNKSFISDWAGFEPHNHLVLNEHLTI